MKVPVVHGWETEIGNNMQQLANLYEELVEELGDDIHLLIFGNLEDPIKRLDLLQKVKQKFTSDVIEKASNYHEYDWWEKPSNYINWNTISLQEATEEVLLAKITYEIVEDSGGLGFKPLERKFHIGRRVLENLDSIDQYKRLGAKKRFTHEYWHYLFTELSKEEQELLITSFKTIIQDQSHTEVIQEFCRLLYEEDTYHIHFPKVGGQYKLFSNEDELGIKSKDTIVVPGTDFEVYTAYLLTEILSLSSEGDFEDIDEYYDAVKPSDPDEQKLWLRKKRLGQLARAIVPKMNNNKISQLFSSQTEKGLMLLNRIARDVADKKAKSNN